MIKPKIYLESANTPWPPAMMPLWQKHFNVEPVSQRQDLSLPCIVVRSQQMWDAGLEQQDRVPGARIDLLAWDRAVLPGTVRPTDSGIAIGVRDWIWMHEHCWYIEKGYEQLTSLPSQVRPDRLFLMLMNLQRRSRDQLRTAVEPWLDSSLHSYVECGIILAGDMPIESHGRQQADRIHKGTKHQRHFYPDWYSRTWFSMVSETTVNTAEWGWPENQLFISEKIFKPCAFRHPAVIHGTRDTLKYLKEMGFATWDHIVDESYDSIDNADQRLVAITKQIDALGQQFQAGADLFRDPESLARLEHNYRLFYNRQRIEQLFYDQIAAPILDFLNSQ